MLQINLRIKVNNKEIIRSHLRFKLMLNKNLINFTVIDFHSATTRKSSNQQLWVVRVMSLTI